MTKRIGNVVFIEQEADDICEVCGGVAELRPYGLFDESKGRRLRVCFPCSEKNPEDRALAFSELCDGKAQ